ncbi:MAG TPA: hypothetical protein VFZ04_06825, partial [Longimicrobiales bacterium]
MFALLLAPLAAAAQVPQPQRERREELEAQIVQRFLSNTASQLQLDNERRNRLEQHLRCSSPRRSALSQ